MGAPYIRVPLSRHKNSSPTPVEGSLSENGGGGKKRSVLPHRAGVTEKREVYLRTFLNLQRSIKRCRPKRIRSSARISSWGNASRVLGHIHVHTAFSKGRSAKAAPRLAVLTLGGSCIPPYRALPSPLQGHQAWAQRFEGITGHCSHHYSHRSPTIHTSW